MTGHKSSCMMTRVRESLQNLLLIEHLQPLLLMMRKSLEEMALNILKLARSLADNSQTICAPSTRDASKRHLTSETNSVNIKTILLPGTTTSSPWTFSCPITVQLPKTRSSLKSTNFCLNSSVSTTWPLKTSRSSTSSSRTRSEASSMSTASTTVRLSRLSP